MIRCEGCCRVIPAGSSTCPSCGFLLSATRLANSLLLGRLAEEFTNELREGKVPDVEEYARKYPALCLQIRDLFPTLVALENAAKEQRPLADHASTKGLSGNSVPSPVTQGRFITGTIVSGRYRIVSLQGKGGMGEVYRAEDLELAQPVALKFLPDKLAFDGAALARFHREVRLARQVTHPNVCRVFDIGEERGQQYLSMEYIDGEDLSSLLRRIGRLPKDKAVDVARQLCAGLAAAHENNVLHRDLKPANVMVDGRGRVKITDFGLAVLADRLGDEMNAGTPAYMAPEQLTRGEFTAKSDMYALGLVLFEVFTGRKVFHADSLVELLRLHERKHPPRPSRLVKEVDRKVEHWIMRCLEKNPQFRPSAIEIAASLSGGDALATAVAAGETPSPEMVAASPGEPALSPVLATASLLAFLASILLMVLLSGKGLLHRAVPLEMSPEVLADHAKTLIKNLGYLVPPLDTAYGFGLSDDYLRFLEAKDPSPDRWKKLRAARPAVLHFWYRQSPSYLVPAGQGRVTADDPPLVAPMMITVFLDTNGNLVEFRAVASNRGPPAGVPASADWKALFDAAGLNATSFGSVDSDWLPPVNSDERATWEGSYPDQPMKITIRAAACRGTPVYFSIMGPWTDIPDARVHAPSARRAGYQRGAQSRLFFVFSFIVFAAASLICAFLARRNLRIGRGDRRGAFRLALWIFAARLLAWLFQTHHVPALGEMELFYSAVAWALFYAGVSWLLYVALEPYIRRRWPYRIISWSRLLAGGVRDPLVGRDVLLGALFGTSSTLLAAYMYLALPTLGFLPDRPPSVALATLLGAREVLGQILAMQREILTDPLYVLVVLLLLTLALRREWLAFGAAWFLFSVVGGALFGVQSAANLAVVSAVVAAYVLVLVRFGLLAVIVFQFYNYLLLNSPLTSNFYAWYASGTILTLLVAVSLACFGYYISLAGQPVFRQGFLKG